MLEAIRGIDSSVVKIVDDVAYNASGDAKTTTATRHRVTNYYDSLSYQDLGPMQPIIHGDLA